MLRSLGMMGTAHSRTRAPPHPRTHALTPSRPHAYSELVLLRSILLIALAPALVQAQEPQTGVVAGRVLARADTAEPSAARGATVLIAGTPLVDTTNLDGRFVLDAVPAGTRTVRIRLAGYRTVERAIRLRAGDTARVDVTLERSVQLLAPVRTDARRADAELFLTKPSISTIAVDASALVGMPRGRRLRCSVSAIVRSRS